MPIELIKCSTAVRIYIYLERLWTLTFSGMFIDTFTAFILLGLLEDSVETSTLKT